MQDFDVAREQRYDAERSFKIGGEVFTRRPGIRPEAMNAYEDLTVEHTSIEALAVIDDLILAFLETDGHERYRKLREREEDPLTIGDLRDLIIWLIRETTRRPTMQPLPSTPGHGESGTPSTAISSSTPDAASAA